MATNETSTETEPKTENSKAIAIVLPALFAVVLVILIAIAFLLPRFNVETEEAREKRRRKRLEKLDKSVKAVGFEDWVKRQRDEHPERWCVGMNPLCVICLDEIEDAANIRGLGCLHVFHQHCLDDWFARCNEFCPLCHRPIIQSMKERRMSWRDREPDPLPIAVMV